MNARSTGQGRGSAGRGGAWATPRWPAIPPSAVAIGWATVELDRAAVELGGMLPDGSAFEPAPGSVVLGARCRMVRVRVGAADLWLVLLEPSTEGRLAGFLARSGEGWAAIWVRPVDGPGPAVGRAVDPGSWLPGPLGPERLASPSTRGAPFRLFVPTATIEP